MTKTLEQLETLYDKAFDLYNIQQMPVKSVADCLKVSLSVAVDLKNLSKKEFVSKWFRPSITQVLKILREFKTIISLMVERISKYKMGGKEWIIKDLNTLLKKLPNGL